MNHDIRIEIVSDIKEAERLWSLFSPHQTIYDAWDFRMCLHKYFQYKIMFHVAYDGDTPIGLIPLQYNHTVGYLEFFGGNYMEDNRVFLKEGYEAYHHELYRSIQGKAKLEYIRGDDPYTTSLPVQDYKYILPLTGIQTIEDYLAKYFDGEARGKFRRKIRKAERQGIRITKNNLEDIETFFDMHIKDFGTDSAFIERPHHKDVFRDLFRLPYEAFLFTFWSEEEIHGISLCILYKKTYEYFNLAVRRDKIRDISTYITTKNIEAAIAAKADVFDAFVGSYGWKEDWHFKKIPQYLFETEDRS